MCILQCTVYVTLPVLYIVHCTVYSACTSQNVRTIQLYQHTTQTVYTIYNTIHYTRELNPCYAPVQYLEGSVEVVLVLEHYSKSDVNLVLAAESRIYVQHLLECFSCPGDVSV